MALLRDGFDTLIGFSLEPAFGMLEVEITPPAIDTGEMIPQDTMRNIAWGMKWFQVLRETGSGKVSFSIKTEWLNRTRIMTGINQRIIITFADGATMAFWGGLRNMVFSNFAKGQRPLVTCDLEATNIDNFGNESGVVFA